ncbi:unnamed protein product [Caenorhabditis nigoni]
MTHEVRQREGQLVCTYLLQKWQAKFASWLTVLGIFFGIVSTILDIQDECDYPYAKKFALCVHKIALAAHMSAVSIQLWSCIKNKKSSKMSVVEYLANSSFTVGCHLVTSGNRQDAIVYFLFSLVGTGNVLTKKFVRMIRNN